MPVSDALALPSGPADGDWQEAVLNPWVDDVSDAIAALEAGGGSFGTIQAAVTAASAGDTILIPQGIYRELVTVDVSMQIIFLDGAEIRGSDNWSVGEETWTSVAAGWRSTSSVPDPGTDTNAVRFTDDTLGPKAAMQVFVDEQPYQLVGIAGETPAAGEYTLDASRRVILPLDPTGHLIEVTTREGWLTIAADDVTLVRPKARHSAADAHVGSITTGLYGGTTYDNLVIVEPELFDSFGQAICLASSSGHRIYGGRITRCGNTGILLMNCTDTEIHRTEIAWSNYWGYWDAEFEAGGIKVTGKLEATFGAEISLTLADLLIHDCQGMGIWFDVVVNGGASHNVKVLRPRIWDCTRAGIEVEASQNIDIDDPVIWNCGHALPGSFSGGGIYGSDCDNVTIRRPLVAWCGDGIVFLFFDRVDATTFGIDLWAYENITVEDPVVLMGRHSDNASNVIAIGYLSSWAVADVTTPANNNGVTGARIWYPYWEGLNIPSPSDNQRFKWYDTSASTADWIHTINLAQDEGLLDADSRYLTDAEMLAVCQRAGIPGVMDDDVGQAMPPHFDPGVVLNLNTPVTVANTTTATTLGDSLAVAANQLGLGTTFRIDARGVYSTTGTPTLTFQVRHGTTALATTGAITLPSGASNRGWYLSAVIRMTDGLMFGGGFWEIQGQLFLSTAAATGEVIDLENTSAPAVTVTSASSLSLNAQWSAASASNTITCRFETIEVLGYVPSTV